jgi:hypothetical protein
VALGLLLAVATASCGSPDRSASADELGDRLGALPGVAAVRVDYTPDTLELHESVRYTVTAEPADGPAAACAVVRAFVDGFAGTGIDADQSSLELRDAGTPPLPWTFSARPDRDGAGAESECVDSQQVRAVPIAYSAAVDASDGEPSSRPSIRLRFRGGAGVATPEEGEALARAHMPSFGDFDWEVLIICGQRPC